MNVSNSLFNPLYYPYPSQRTVTYAKNGMVATSQPLAAQAGLDTLKKGGNAVDAAIAAAACLTVVEPTSNGIGGDAFAIVWMDGKLHGLNSSGPAPKRLSADLLKANGFDQMPRHGWEPVTVPGAPAAWAELSKKFGNLPFEEVLQPAITYAEEGFPISPITGYFWDKSFKEFQGQLKNPLFEHWFSLFATKNSAPKVGEMWKSPSHADTLRSIARTHAESFYRGELAAKLDAFSNATGGYIRADDLADYYPEWVEPIGINYKGYDIWELPPNGQGLVALLALNILKGFDFTERETPETYHKQIESLKLAFADGKALISDPSEMTADLGELLSDAYAQKRRRLIGSTALWPEAEKPVESGTVYLAAADQEGNMVSFIQSNYNDFGSAVVVPGTGINLQNRGHNFSLDPNHVNYLKPEKRTYHTIIPGFITKEGKAFSAFGVMGGFMQPQGHLQVISNMIDFHMNPQAALDAPRWHWSGDKSIHIEHGVAPHIGKELDAKGHDVTVEINPKCFGRGQIIIKDPETSVWIGGTDHRTDGTIAAW
ncbi:gamma-glutamyltransferase family protein [Siminovitchia sediminis]|uniref:Gamma-glutamyltransferase family protein n=1 Tax=Siminovitchia sediminis TaxID=1274353 RepID=A0ABW4KIM5_9BACI